MRRRAWLTLSTCCLAAFLTWKLPERNVRAVAPPDVPLHPVEFNRDVRPILSENCFACHGPDKGKRKGEFRIDTEAGAFANLGEHFALVAGRPDKSVVYERLIEKGARRMPPAKSGKKLTPQQIELIRRWIEEGANWQKHWALIRPTRPALPSNRDRSWARNAIDQFVLERLEKEGLRPSREADKRTLLRRLSYDLTGLPPTPSAMSAFLADQSANAYEKAVDRLLSSPHYGERMALYWLDLVRFGDTGGYHSDNHRDVYLYRDYVISAFNNNKPFDAFTREQLAGDLLPDATAAQKIASGYNRLLMTTEEGGAQAKEYTAKYAADRVRNASTVWLGLTLGCAECHDHKFDPLTTKEFYSFASFFADVREVPVGRQPQVRMATPAQEKQLRQLDQELVQVTKALDSPSPATLAGQARWEESARAELSKSKPEWLAVKPKSAESKGGAKLVVQADLSVLSTGPNPARDTYLVALPTGPAPVTAIRLEALTHSSFGNQSLSRGNGNFVVTGFEVDAVTGKGDPRPVKLARALADFSQPGYPVGSLVAGPSKTGWAVEGHVRRENRTAVFAFAKPLPGGPDTALVVKMTHASAFPQHNIGRFRLSLTSAAKPGLSNKANLPEPIVQALLADPARRNPAQKKALASYYRGIAPELAPLRGRLADLRKQKTALEAKLPSTLVSTSGPPRTMRVLPRGNWLDDSGEIVSPGVPKSLNRLGVKGRRATRLDLAQWLTAPENPLTARIFVNRMWKQLYGQGLVSTLDDFGAQGAWPTHPELLDWLAVEFRESSWDVKHLVRLMATSATYRQSSAAPEQLRQRDPYNKLLARQGHWRLDAELVRDNALAASGLLATRLGGPSVKPYQPAGYWAYLNFPRRTYDPDKGPDQYRRGLYTYVQRTFPHPSLIAFDGSSREECTVERARSNTPVQALVLLNDPTYVEAARVLAEHALTRGGKDTDARLRYAYQRALQRAPRPAEAEVLKGLLVRHLAQYRADKAAVDAVLKIGDAPVSSAVDRAELAAWASVTRTLLNLHETITRD